VPLKVFISHGSHDTWIAEQMARCVREQGADVFLDKNDIATGDDFKELIRSEISAADELVALFTPFSRDRSWLWTEVGAAWLAGKRLVPVFYGMTINDLEREGGGASVLAGLHHRQLNAFRGYLDELHTRVTHG
jgi:hypothetical protein